MNRMKYLPHTLRSCGMWHHVFCCLNLLMFHNNTLLPPSGYRQQVPPKSECIYTSLQGVTTQNTLFFTVTAEKTSNFSFRYCIIGLAVGTTQSLSETSSSVFKGKHVGRINLTSHLFVRFSKLPLINTHFYV
jgi:hypothetical protein